MKRLLPLLAVLALASCQTPPAEPEDRFARADRNGDGLLSKEDIVTLVVSDVFVSIDADGDGVITPQEWWPSPDKEQFAAFKRRDLNGDGVVTLEEAVQYAMTKPEWDELMAEVDTNNDGKVTREEGIAYYAEREGPMR